MCHQGVEKVFHLAASTFSRARRASPEALKKSLDNLVVHTDRLTGADVGLELCSALQEPGNSPSNTLDGPESEDRYRPSRPKPPVTYIPVSETRDISMGIFVIREGENIPLHDHPDMHGIIKCLAGQLKVTSFTRRTVPGQATLPERFMRSSTLMQKLLQGELFLAEQLLPAKQVSTESGSCVLEPLTANIHTIESVGGPAAFLDILAPPYNVEPGPGAGDPEERDCHYYTVLPDAGPGPNLHWLVLTPPPPTFFCDTEPYRGPPVGAH